MTKLRHGFKAEAERLALELRAELGLGRRDRVDPQALADLYGIPVVDASELEAPTGKVDYLAAVESGAWSAITVFHGTRRMIVLNDRHDPRRRANSLAHELAHVFLEHEPAPVLHPDGSRTWSDTVEAEANELGAQILIPTQTARELAIQGRDPDYVADQFEVSTHLARWRLNVSGGYVIRRRAKANR